MYDEYHYVKYRWQWFVLGRDSYEEFMSIPRDSTVPFVDPYKFSVAMLSKKGRQIHVTLITGYEYDFEIGIKRDWIAFVEAIYKGIEMFEADIDRQIEIKKFRETGKR